jgi:hypothetical protein
MLKAPPLFDITTAAPPPAQPPKSSEAALVLCDAQQTGAGELPPGYGPEATPECWALATAIANEVLDATTLAEVDAIAGRRAGDIKTLVAKRRDLALTLSTVFTDQRRQLGGGR